MSVYKILKFVGVVAALVLIAVGVVGYRLYGRIYGNNMNTSEKKTVFMYIPTDSDFDFVLSQLQEIGLRDVSSFLWVANKMNYPSRVRSGRYSITDGISNIDLVRMLRSGQQVPVNVIFNNIRFNTQLAGAVATFIEADSASIIALLTDSDYLMENFNHNPQTIMSMCIPNTYEFFWNTSASGFLDRMKRESDRFWTETRLEKARNANLTPLQVITMASIIEEETKQDSEKSRMAGVYVNRINRGMLLQADPTLKFALGDFTIQRLLNRDMTIDSPYNTYRYVGLPPGPICIPSIITIDAVLNYEKHDYLFFCARVDFSGYHSFARTLQEHSRNAQAYHRALNNSNIFR